MNTQGIYYLLHTFLSILFWYNSSNTKSSSGAHSGRFSFSFYIFTFFLLFFKGSFHPTVLHDERVFQYLLGFRFFQLSVSRFEQFSFTFSFSLFSICRPNMIYLWLFTQWHQTHWILYTEPLFVNAHTVIFVEGGGQKVQARHMKAEWEKSIIVNTCVVHSFCPFTLRT